MTIIHDNTYYPSKKKKKKKTVSDSVTDKLVYSIQSTKRNYIFTDDTQANGSRIKCDSNHYLYY